MEQVDQLQEELEREWLRPMNTAELQTHLKQKVRRAKLDFEEINWAQGLLNLQQNEAEMKRSLEELEDRLPKRAAELTRLEEQMVNEHNTRMRARLAQAADAIDREIQAQRQQAQEEINAVLARKEQAIAQLNKEVTDAENRRTVAEARTNELNSQAKQSEARLSQLNQTIANRLKEEENKVKALQRDQNELTKLVSEMKAERDALLRRFGSPA